MHYLHRVQGLQLTVWGEYISEIFGLTTGVSAATLVIGKLQACGDSQTIALDCCISFTMVKNIRNSEISR